MARVPAALLPLIAVLAACSRGEDGAVGPDQEPAGVLWETPPTPGPVRVIVDGLEVPDAVVQGWLEPEWQHFFQERYDRATPEQAQAAEREFLADPPRLFEGLVRAVLMLREAERRRPEIDAGEFDALLADFRKDSGGLYDTLARDRGEEGVRAHLERIWRLRKLEEDFDSEVAAPGEPAIAEEYQRIVEQWSAENPEQSPPSFAELHDRLVRKLAVEERNRRIEAWIDERRPATRVEVELPDGERVSLPPPTGQKAMPTAR